MAGRLRLPGLAVVLNLAACSEAPIPLPVRDDLGLHRECSCVTRDRCTYLDLAEGTGQSRNFQCRWTDRQAKRATCSTEGRFKPLGGTWSKWERSVYRFRHLGEQGWCWDRLAYEGGEFPSR